MYTIIGSDGHRYGPVDSATLQTWVSMGRVTRDTLVILHESGEQLVAAQIPHLQVYFSAPPLYPQPLASPSIRQPGIVQMTAGTHSVGTALILALLITGLGQVYNKQAMKGLLILLISVILAAFTCGLSILLTHPFAFIDAILIAQRLNRGEAISEWQCF